MTAVGSSVLVSQFRLDPNSKCDLFISKFLHFQIAMFVYEIEMGKEKNGNLIAEIQTYWFAHQCNHSEIPAAAKINVWRLCAVFLLLRILYFVCCSVFVLVFVLDMRTSEIEIYIFQNRTNCRVCGSICVAWFFFLSCSSLFHYHLMDVVRFLCIHTPV